jgi:K+-transporting ATPase ATPase C chain
MKNSEIEHNKSNDSAGILRPALTLFIALSVITGLAYPALVTVAAKAAFSEQATGSLVKKGTQTVGSELIGQAFSDPAHFWGRPSATSPMSHNASSSGGSNLGPSNIALRDAVKERVEALHQVDPENQSTIPVDLITASASGLDPHISVAAARYQIPRIAKVRKLSNSQLNNLIEHHTQGIWLGFLGEPRVNVLKLNLALDALGAQE